MSFLRTLKLRTKLPLLIFVTVALTVAGFISLLAHEGWKSAEANAFERLDATMAEDQAAVRGWIGRVRSDLEVNAGELTSQSALATLTWAFSALGDDAMGQVQRLYITDNPHSQGARHLYDFSADNSGYSIAHKRFHGFFRALRQSRGYRDVYLLDAAGTVVYSVAKQGDLGRNMAQGAAAESGLGAAFRGAVARAGADDPVFLVDFAPYGPAGNAMAGFAAIAMTDETGAVQGVLALQMPTDQIAPLLSSAGTGDASVRVMVVGPDHLPRNQTDEAGLSPVKSPALERALTGGAGRMEGPLSAGEPGLTTYAPIELGGFRWAVAAEMPNRAAYGAINRLIVESAIGGAALLALATALGVALSRGIIGPVNGIRLGLETLARGSYDAPTPGRERGDELGQMARSAEALRDTLGAARVAARDSLFRGAGFQAGSAPMLLLDDSLRASYANTAMEGFLERHAGIFATHALFDGKEPLTGQPIDRLMPNPASIKKAVAHPESLPTTLYYRLGDTRFSMRIGVVADETGQTIGTVVELANATEDFMNRALMGTIDSFLATIKMDRQARILEVNGTMASLLGYAAEEMVGTAAPEVFKFDPALAAERGNVIDRLKQGETIFGLFRLRGAEGRVHWLQGGFSPVPDTDGQPAMFLFMGSDITADREKLMAAERDQQRVARAQAQVVDSLRLGLTALAEGDLTRLLDERFADEYDALRNNFNAAASGLREAIAVVMENAGAIHREVGEIAASADDLSRRTERQATTLEQTAAALDQLTSSVRSAADGAERANRMVEEARGNAEQGGQVVSEAVAAMGRISESSEQISKIISVIDDIAFQTNLLALNAGVEAARAGEAGRGFAVVASEVRALAQRSSDAAREISGLISSSGDHVRRGVDLVGQTGEALRGIVASVTDIASHVSEIARSAQEQAGGLDEINTAMNQLDQVTQQNAAMFEQTNAASQALSAEANTLRNTVGRFQIGDSDAEAETRQEVQAEARPGARLASTGAMASPETRGAAPIAGTAMPATATPQRAPAREPGSATPTFRSGRQSAPATDGNAALVLTSADDGWEEF